MRWSGDFDVCGLSFIFFSSNNHVGNSLIWLITILFKTIISMYIVCCWKANTLCIMRRKVWDLWFWFFKHHMKVFLGIFWNVPKCNCEIALSRSEMQIGVYDCACARAWVKNCERTFTEKWLHMFNSVILWSLLCTVINYNIFFCFIYLSKKKKIIFLFKVSLISCIISCLYLLFCQVIVNLV